MHVFSKIHFLFVCFSTSKDESQELALYNSIDESEPCVFCNKDIEDPINFGIKLTMNGVTAHHFCLVSNFVCCGSFCFVVVIIIIVLSRIASQLKFVSEANEFK